MHALPASGVFAERFALCEAFASRWCAHGARTAKLLSTERWQGECFSFGVKPSGRDVLGKTGILPVAATPGSYSFAHRRLSRRRPRGSAALPLVATSYDPLGERGAGGLTVAQRLRAPRSGNAQDARCPSKPPRWRLPMLRRVRRPRPTGGRAGARPSRREGRRWRNGGEN